jgi:hypothetical protein
MTLAISPTWTSAKLEGERDGRLRFSGELTTDELELAGARWRSIPYPLSLTREAHLSRVTRTGRSWSGPRVLGRADGLDRPNDRFRFSFLVFPSFFSHIFMLYFKLYISCNIDPNEVIPNLFGSLQSIVCRKNIKH